MRLWERASASWHRETSQKSHYRPAEFMIHDGAIEYSTGKLLPSLRQNTSPVPQKVAPV